MNEQRRGRESGDGHGVKERSEAVTFDRSAYAQTLFSRNLVPRSHENVNFLTEGVPPLGSFRHKPKRRRLPK